MQEWEGEWVDSNPGKRNPGHNQPNWAYINNEDPGFRVVGLSREFAQSSLWMFLRIPNIQYCRIKWTRTGKMNQTWTIQGLMGKGNLRI